jgi:predicted secreted protein
MSECVMSVGALKSSLLWRNNVHGTEKKNIKNKQGLGYLDARSHQTFRGYQLRHSWIKFKIFRYLLCLCHQGHYGP